MMTKMITKDDEVEDEYKMMMKIITVEGLKLMLMTRVKLLMKMSMMMVREETMILMLSSQLEEEKEKMHNCSNQRTDMCFIRLQILRK